MDARKVLAELRELLRVCYASWRRSDASSDGRQWQRLSTCSSAADVAAMLFCYSAILLFCYSEVLALCACIVCHEKLAWLLQIAKKRVWRLDARPAGISL